MDALTAKNALVSAIGTIGGTATSVIDVHIGVQKDVCQMEVAKELLIFIK